MDLYAFARMVLRRGWLALALAAVFAALGYGYAATRTTIYEAVTPVRLQPSRPADLGQTQAIKELMRSFQQDIRTFDMASAVRARLCGDPGEVAQRLCATRDEGAIRDMIAVGSDPNVFEIQVAARSTDPAEAVKVSEQTAHAFVDQRDKTNRQLFLDERIIAGVRDVPQPALWSPRRKLIVGLAGAAGLALGAVLVLLLEYLEQAAVRGRRDAETAVRAPVLATVPPGRGRRPLALAAGLREAAGPLRRAAALAVPIVLLAVLGAAAAFAFGRATPTVYVARTRVAVEPALGSDWGRSQAIREITRGFSRDIATRRMAQRVSDELQLDEPPDRLLGRTNVAEQGDVYEITIEARDQNEAAAADISRTWGQLFVEERLLGNQELDQRDRILVRLRDRTLTEVWSPKTRASVLAGALVGAIVGAAAIYLLHLLGSGTVRGAAEAVAAAGAPLLGSIPPARARRKQDRWAAS